MPSGGVHSRDVKGLYAKALRGEIAQFTGVSDPYEEPHTPEVVVETDRQHPAESVAVILRRLEVLGYLAADRGGGLRSLALPKYLIDALEAQLPETSFRDVPRLCDTPADPSRLGEPPLCPAGR
jgi:hypothetical protein